MQNGQNEKGQKLFKCIETCLLRLVKKFPNILENKKLTVSPTKIWTRIASDFHSEGNSDRGLKNLRNKYNEMKKAYRKKVAGNRAGLYGTGGGLVHEIEFTAHDEILGTIIN